jgi:hypothetical protein
MFFICDISFSFDIICITQNPVVVHRALLEKWFSKIAIQNKVEAFKTSLTPEQNGFFRAKPSKKDNQEDEKLSTSSFQVRCRHSHLDPRHSGNIKCLSKVIRSST